MKYEEGRYHCEVTGQGFGETKNAKLPQLWVTFNPLVRYLSGGEREPVADAQKRSISRLLTNRDGDVTDDMQKYLALDLQCLGFSGDLEDFGPDSDNFCNLTGNEFIARCKYTQRDENEYENWSIEWPSGGGGGGSSALEDTTIAHLSSLYSAVPKKGEQTKEKATTSERF